VGCAQAALGFIRVHFVVKDFSTAWIQLMRRAGRQRRVHIALPLDFAALSKLIHNNRQRHAQQKLPPAPATAIGGAGFSFGSSMSDGN